MRALFLSLLLALPALAGEHLRFLLPVGPAGRPSTVHAYVFNSKREVFRVVDQGGLSHQAQPDLGAAALESGAAAGINGGPFDTRGEPLGLVIADGRASGVALASGGVLWEEEGKTGLSPAATYDFNRTHASQLLQAGPFLIANGAVAPELDASRYHRRSLVLTDGADLWAIAYVPGATLEGLAKALAKPGGFPAFRPKTVLNLDGGAASGLWLRRENGQQFYLREISKIRNCLVVVPSNHGGLLLITIPFGQNGRAVLVTAGSPRAQAPAVSMKSICCVFAAFAFASCAQMSHVKDVTAGGFSKVSGGMAKIGEASKNSFAKLIPSKIPVVEVREKDLREVKTGEQQAVAFEKTRRQRFWFFGGPADFEEPDLPDTAGVMDGGLLPPKME